jgi:DNA replication protein DnaC
MEKVNSILARSSENQEVPQTNELSEGKSSISQNNCEFCGIESTPHEITGFGSIPARIMYFPDCDCAAKERAKQDKERAAKEIESRIKASIPAKFHKCTLETFIPRDKRQQSALDVIKQNPAGSYYFHGSYGNGKTHLLCAQFRACYQKQNCYMRTTSELIQEIRQEELGGEASSIMWNLRQRSYFHLFWDDCDKVKTTDFKLEIIFELVDGIYRHEMGLSVTGNSNLLELQSKLSPAICRRIDDICQVVEL